MHSKTKRNGHVWVCGDFNLPAIKWNDGAVVPLGSGDRQHHLRFTKTIMDFNLTQVVEISTRGDNILDLFLTNSPELVKRVQTAPPSGNNDNDILFVEVGLVPPRKRPVPRKILKLNSANWEEMKSDATKLSDDINNLQPDTDANTIWLKFRDGITSSIERNVPSKMLRSRDKHPWITRDLQRLIRSRDRAFTMRKRSIAKNKHYKVVKSAVQLALRKAFNSYIENMISEAPSDAMDPDSRPPKPKRFFSYLKSLPKSGDGVAPLKSNGILVTENLDKANILNNQFVSVFSQDNGCAIPDKGVSNHPTMPNITIIGRIVISIFVIKRRIIKVRVGGNCECQYPCLLRKPYFITIKRRWPNIRKYIATCELPCGCWFAYSCFT